MNFISLFLAIYLHKHNPLEARFIHFSPSESHRNSGHWHVKKDDFLFIKNNLKAFIQTQVKSDHQVLKNWSDYTFQVYGIINHEKKMMININGFCKNLTLYNGTYSKEKSRIEFTPHVRDVTTTIINPLGGGACYLSIRFDPQEHQFTSFSTNEPSTIYPEETYPALKQ